MNVKSILERIQKLLKERHIQVGLIVFLLVLLSFGIGYIAGRDFNPAPIVIEQAK